MSDFSYEDCVFINCPYDPGYKPLSWAATFAVQHAGFVARAAAEVSSGVRITRILDIMERCKLGIHDLSMVELDDDTGLPRFNMPFELGLFIGARRFGSDTQQEKEFLILDARRYRYRESCSDLAGYDPVCHAGEERRVIHHVIDWLNEFVDSREMLPGGSSVCQDYDRFLCELPIFLSANRMNEADVDFRRYCELVRRWLEANRPRD